MSVLSYISIVMVGLGAVILSVSLFRYLAILQKFQGFIGSQKLFSNWIYFISAMLIIFFLIGYLAVAIWFILSPKLDPLQLVVGLVFFFGSVFVFIMVGVAKRMFASFSEGNTLREQKEIAEQAFVAKSDYLSRVSHEMRTPMNAIIGMSTVGKLTVDQSKKNYCFERIEAASNYLSGVINDMLDINKIESGSFEIGMAAFDLHQMLDNLVKVGIYRASERKQTLAVKIDESIPKHIVLDEQRLRQVLMNILGNALKFTPERGQINLAADLLRYDGGRCYLRFDITDNGIGIPVSAIDTLFDSYRQVNKGLARRYGGVGLGLAISKQIIEHMGGDIRVSSVLGKGSSFTVTLSAEVTDVKTCESDALCKQRQLFAASVESCFAGSKILVADDMGINREIVRSLLEATQITIDEAADGRQAIELFKSKPLDYDLILMDIQMPDIDGLTATREIRLLDIPRAKDIPIVAMTANTFREDINSYLAAGMNSYISKPLSMDELIAKIGGFIPQAKAG